MAASEHRPVLIVIADPNGSGKTSVTSKILHHEWLEDSESVRLPNAMSKSSPTGLQPSFRDRKRQRNRCLSYKFDISYLYQEPSYD